MALKRYQLWVKVSDKFASRVRSMQTRLAKVDHLDRPTLERRRMGLELNGWRGSNQVLELANVSKSFPPRRILDQHQSAHPTWREGRVDRCQWDREIRAVAI